MTEHRSLVRQVRRNCTVSDARFAGSYSVCGLAMRLRDLYKWEHSLPPYEEHDASQVLAWIGQKEALWDNLQHIDFEDLVIDGQTFDPFDTESINPLIAPRNLFYSAGYAHSLKPSFLLAAVGTKTIVNGHSVVFLSSELARDLLTLPALVQDRTILIRQAAIGLYVWDQILYLNRSGRPFYEFALAACGLSPQAAGSPKHCLPKVAAALQDTFLYHEIGELTDTCFDPGVWREIIAALPHTPVELLARTVKDMLADTGPEGTLPHIVRTRHRAALGFYAAFLGGLGKQLFPEIRSTVKAFLYDDDWRAVAQVIRAVHGKAAVMAQNITSVFREGSHENDVDTAWIVEELTRQYIEPLAVVSP